jgi:ubiquinone/menaquinone biosynthesis C-methylase UbiE
LADRVEAGLSTDLAPGLHVAAGRQADVAAYDGWVGRWSRLFVPAVLAAANVAPGSRVLDVSTGTGEAASGMLPIVGESGAVIGVDIAPAMVAGARNRLDSRSFFPVVADGQILPFRDGSFDAAVCQLGLQFFPDPPRGLAEFHRVLRGGCHAAICVISSPDRAPMWGVLADIVSRYVPEQRDLLHLAFALSDAGRLESMFLAAGFQDVRVERMQQQDTIDTFEEYWNPIEAGMGATPQMYMSLPEAKRILVREEVRTELSRFELNGKLVMEVEMLIAAGTA